MLVCATFFSTIAYAQVIPVNSHQQVIDLAMQNYWGKARLQDGSTFQLASDKDRVTIPILKKPLMGLETMTEPIH